MKHPAPYVAATGFTTPGQLHALHRSWSAPDDTARFAPRRRVVGFLVSAKTLRGVPVTNRRYPPSMEWVSLLVQQSLRDGFLPAVHYNTRAAGDALREELFALFVAVPRARMLQLNVERPEVAPLRAFREAHPDVEIVLQLNAATRAECPLGTAWGACARYADVIDHALLDLSRGEGKALSVPQVAGDIVTSMTRFHRANVRLGVAGGLGPEARGVLDDLRAKVGDERFDALSFDAESALRSPADDPTPGERYQDRLCVEKTRAWFELFAKDAAR